MNKNIASKIKISSFDDLFEMNDKVDKTEEIKYVPLGQLHEFKNHPFRLRNGEKMDELVASIRERGVLVPGIARIRPEGGYEIIAGHSRKIACEILGMTEMPMFIRNISDDEATIVMVDSNIQREDILPSERAKAYKLKYEAIKHQGKRGNSLDMIIEESGGSKKVIQRYIKLTDLNDELLDMLDNKQLGFTQAVDLSFLSLEEQDVLLEVLEQNKPKLSIKQSSEIKKLSQEGNFSKSRVLEALIPAEGKKVRDVRLKSDRLDQYFADNFTEGDIENIIYSLLEKWKKESEM